MDKQVSVGRDFLINRYTLTLGELEDWIEECKKILMDHPEYNRPQISFSSNYGDYDSEEICMTVFRPETEKEKSFRESQEEYNKKEDRRRFDSYKEKYGW